MKILRPAAIAATLVFATAGSASAATLLDVFFPGLALQQQQYQQQQYQQSYQQEQYQQQVSLQPTHEASEYHGAETVRFSGTQKPGTVIVNTSERKLYYVLAGGKAVRYSVGVGREGFAWSGTKAVTAKQEWPEWRPPADMLQRRPDLPRFMAGGPRNPLGARAMYLGDSLYRIHGTNEPDTIGHAVSSGCIRMLNEDVIDLYARVQVGTQVVVTR
jgi:lipoprotein-anchoring transpeptidase ErfK/SrfK